MKHYDNIEKHPIKPGYIGYTADGYGRHIEKSTSSYGNWIAWPHKGEGVIARPIYAMRLADIGKALESVKQS